MIQKAKQLWATGDWQLHQDNAPTHASHLVQFGETSNHPGDSAPLQPRFGTLQFLTFPNTKITFEGEDISDYETQEYTTGQLTAVGRTM